MNTIEFRHIPPEDETVDAATAVFIDGKDRDIEIQHTEYAGPGARRSVNRYFRDAKGSITGMRTIGEYDTEEEARQAVLLALIEEIYE